MNKYEKPVLEVLKFDGEDIITTSPDITPDENETEIMPFNPTP